MIILLDRAILKKLYLLAKTTTDHEIIRQLFNFATDNKIRFLFWYLQFNDNLPTDISVFKLRTSFKNTPAQY